MTKKVWRSALSLIAAGCLGGAVTAGVLTHFPSSQQSSQVSTVKYNTQTSTTEAVKSVQDAVVSVLTYTKSSNSDLENFYRQILGEDQETTTTSEDGTQLAGEGSGVIYKKEGKYAYVVTNNHVVSGAEKLEIMLADGSKVDGELVGADTYSDLAVVKISADKVKTVASFADSSALNVGEPAIAIGSPLGSEYANSVTEGIVSSLSRTVTSQNEDGETISTNAIQTDAAINPGNSGGPLINIEGQVIGINSSKITASGISNNVAVEGMGFAIPSNDVVSIIKQLEKTGHVERPALGITMANLSSVPSSALDKLALPDNVTSGIVVVSTQAGMPADGKLTSYDVITAIDDEAVSTTSDLQSVLYKHQVGDTISLTFYRGKDKKTVDIKLQKTTQDLTTNKE